MKIAFVSPYSWTVPGGVNRHIALLGAELRRRGHDVRILAPADGPVEPGVVSLGRTIGVPFNGSVARLAFGPRVAGRVRVALRRARPDIVHVHEPFTPSASLLALTITNAPTVATFHVAGESRAYRASRVPLGPLWRKLDARIAVSQAARATVEQIFGPGARIVPNGVDVAAFAGVPPVEPGGTVLFFGRLEKRKGPGVLLEAATDLLDRRRDTRVIIAGDGPMAAELRGKVAPRHAADISFTGYFDPADQISLLSAATVVSLPALGGESFGLTVVEAMAAGRPLVASDIPGYAAVIGDAGVLVPPGDAQALSRALGALLDDPARLQDLAEQGRKRASGFDWPIVAEEIESVYKEVLARRAR